MRKSIKDMLKVLGENAGEEETALKTSPAERLGRALLDSLGAQELDEEELVEALLGEWENRDREPAKSAEPVFGTPKRPIPMKTGSNASSPVDYADMSREQFRELKKLLKKAAMDGKRIKI